MTGDVKVRFCERARVGGVDMSVGVVTIVDELSEKLLEG